MNVCANCATPRETGHRYCWKCGARLDAQRELKQATVLLADLCNSTALLDRIDVEDGQAWLDRALHVMSEAVEAYGGTCMQWRGDELLAIFGAPQALEDHALRACLAALAMHEGMRANSTPDVPLRVRVGIASGEVLVGPGGETVASSYRADGLTIHQASRLERLAAPGTVLVSAATLRLTHGQIEALSLGTRTLRGIAAPVEVHELVIPDDGSAAAPLARRRYLAPLVGREDALDDVARIADEARAGALRAVGLRGEAGVGKSRFIEALCARLRESGFKTVSVAARAYASDIPFRLIGDVVRALLELPVESDRDTARHEPALADLLDGGDPGEVWRSLTPPQRRERIAETAVWLTSERTGRGPLVLVIEDLFLADRESLRLLESLLPHLAAQPLLLVLSYRSDFVHRWGPCGWFVERWLGPLTEGQMTQLARVLLGDDASLGRVRAALLERAGGNPFFFEQMVISLIDEGVLVGSPGAYHGADAASPLRVPGSIMAVIGARADRMPAEAKACLEAAAVTGEPILADRLAAMLDLETAAVEGHLRLALGAGLITAGPGGYAFRHGLVAESLLAALPRSRRRALHRAAFEAMCRLGDDGVPDQVAVLAHHAYQGEVWPAAADYALKAMARSITRSANRDALRLFEQGLDAASRIAPQEAAWARELALRAEAQGAYMALGQIDAIVENLERAEFITRAIGDTRRQAAISLQLAVSLWSRADYLRGLEAATDAGEAAVAAGSRSLQMTALQARMMLNHALGRYADASADADRLEREFAVELAQRRLLPGWAVLAAVNVKAFRSELLTFADDLDAAQQALDGAYAELVGDHDHAFSRILADFARAGLLIAQDRSGDAAALLETTLERCRRDDVPTMLPTILARLCGALALSGRAERALERLERADEAQAYREGGRYNDYYFAYYLATARWKAGRLAEAIATARRAVEVAGSFGQNGHRALALCLLAQIEHEAGLDAAATLAAAGEAAAGCGMVRLAAQVASVAGSGAVQRAHDPARPDTTS